MKPSQAAKFAAQSLLDPFETLNSQVAKPLLDEAAFELGSFFGTPKGIGRNPKSIAQEDLQRARNAHKIQEKTKEDQQKSQENVQKLVSSIRQEYTAFQAKESREQSQMKQEMHELQSEVVKLAKTAGVETNAHLEQTPKKVGVIDVKRLTVIVRTLRLKAEESKSGKDLVSARSNAKRSTGMMAWVSGKQMKVHEQGTLQLQG